MRPALAEATPTTIPSGDFASLRVEREGIAFENIAPDQVRIAVTVTNEGDEPSAQTFAVVSAAVLGAFVPWKPLATLLVPTLEPGESTVLQAVVPAPAAAPLGPPDRVTPQQLLTALGLPDDDGSDDRNRRRADARRGFGLPTDPLHLLGRGGLHWAGNLNVFIGGKAVERHLAQALRVYPGRVNMAVFFVGSRRDAYRFDLHGCAVDWDVSLHDMTRAGSVPWGSAPLTLGDWHEVKRTGHILLKSCPPADRGQGSVEVHVTQQSTGKTAVVEFSLDPAAAGPGCFTV